MKNTAVDTYLTIGCGRCPLVGTPDCKVHQWTAELSLLRMIILDGGLTEEVKWSVPCYTFQGNNVLILSAFKSFCSVSFFKGVLLKDGKKLLDKAGESSQAARLFKFTDVQQIERLEDDIKAYILEAIEIEKAGLKVHFESNPEPIPQELQDRFDESPAFKNAFMTLTPGRRRGYIIHFSQPKQSKTRQSRIEKCVDRIFSGKGMQD
jgi:uncharacterized protein YdeI (YjbR/CyaY-like superfamily)